MDNQSSLILTYITKDQESSETLRDILLEHISNDEILNYECDKQSYTNNDEVVVFYKTVLVLLANSEISLVQLDTIRSGWVEDIDMEKHGRDIMSIRASVDIMDEADTNDLIQYLHNLSQDQQDRVEMLELDNMTLNSTLVFQQKQLTILTEQYSMLQAYLHSYINITGLVKIVRDIAEKVDPDILDDYEMVKIH